MESNNREYKSIIFCRCSLQVGPIRQSTEIVSELSERVKTRKLTNDVHSHMRSSSGLYTRENYTSTCVIMPNQPGGPLSTRVPSSSNDRRHSSRSSQTDANKVIATEILMWPPLYEDTMGSSPQSIYSVPGGDYYTEITGLIETATDGETRS